MMRASTPSSSSSSSSSTSCSTSSSSQKSFLPVSRSNNERRRRRRNTTAHLSKRRRQEKQQKRRQQKTGVLDTNDVVFDVARCESGDDGDGRRGRRKKTRSHSRDVRTFSSSSSSSSNKKVVSAATAFENATTSVSIDWNSQIRKAKDERVGVLLLNLGGPETLDDVEPFLFNLFADPDIIRLPSTSFKSKRIWFLLLLFFFFALKMMCCFDLIFVVAFFSRFVYARIVFCLCLCLCARNHRNLMTRDYLTDKRRVFLLLQQLEKQMVYNSCKRSSRRW